MRHPKNRTVTARLAVSSDWPRFPMLEDKTYIWFPPGEAEPVITAPGRKLERLYLADFLDVSELTPVEWKELENIIEVRIPERGRELIHRAINHFVLHNCLKNRQPTWREIERRLEEIKETGERLLELCNANPADVIGTRAKKHIERGIARHVLSVGQIVSRYLVHRLYIPSGQSPTRYLQPVGDVVGACNRALMSARKRASKRGPKSGLALSYYVKTVVVVACRCKKTTEFELPSPKTKNFLLAKYPLLQFVRRTMEMGASKGLDAIQDNTEMTFEEKRLATIALNAVKDSNQLRRSIVDLVRADLSDHALKNMVAGIHKPRRTA